ncbi:hypothetical protein [Fluviicola taffensis]|uniref:Uncharacterized protein n=1 Tax=Fluviicola taffensis (strain DSM 16823 / NCIMB 13979 / RW262) TaxID=755732 RepID=F2IE71_FLUTR|nr:hypothetical protein [Fluviicola taffensis]AEA42389.1 hypothetical protein Fluta_0381 [Fluviicola taffensis DSM 16823]
MVFTKKYGFQINQNKDTLTQTLKDLSKENLIEQNRIGDDSFYSIEFIWDEFFVTRKAKLFERSMGIEPDAYIRLTSLSDNLTQIDVRIKFSEIVWIILIFVQLGIIAVSLFGINVDGLNWWYRILIMIGISGLWNFILWLILIQGLKKLKKVITQLFEKL